MFNIEGDYNTASVKLPNREDVETECLDQIQEMADHKAFEGNSDIAIMPDCHWGAGAVIGFTMPLKDRVCPNTIGVDIGCFAAGTKIDTLDGDKNIKELANKSESFGVYSCEEDGSVKIAEATAKKTRENAELIKVTIDNDEEIICTPDHEFMLRNGEYKEAKNLENGESLMPLYKGKTEDGYNLVYDNKEGMHYNSKREHWMVARSELMNIPEDIEKPVVHHKNFEKDDNRPENLEIMSASEHSRFHRQIAERNEHWQSEEFEKARIKALKEREPTEKEIETAKENITAWMENNPEQFKKLSEKAGERGKKYLRDHNTSEKECGICGEVCENPAAEYWHQVKNHANETEYALSSNAEKVANNHKVISTEKLDRKENVYCLTVPEYGNFALSAGVFVHNCGMYAAKLGEAPLNDLESLDNAIREKIPMGFKVHDRSEYHFKEDFPWEKCREKAETFNKNSDMPDVDTDYGIEYFKNLVEKLGYKTGRTINSMGTLGGGNHFIEIGESQETGDTWCVIHSGSRGIGAQIAQHWQDKATELRTIDNMRAVQKAWEHIIVTDRKVNLNNYVKFNRHDSSEEILEWLNGAKGESYKKQEKIKEDFEGEEIEEVHNHLREIQKDRNNNRNTDLDYLEGEEATGYIKDMIFAQTYASESRKEMMSRVFKATDEVADRTISEGFANWAENRERIESIHNYIDFTDQKIRKGACSAHTGEKIVIPFNMNYGTLIAEGKGKNDWNSSAPHGAGRAMSRTAAKQKYSEDDMEDQTEGVYMSKKPVDETPKAYKNPEMVEDAIGETAEIIDRIKPVLSIKAE